MAFIDNLTTLRVRAGVTISDLAREAGLDRGTIKNVEKHRNATLETCVAIINALNRLYYSKNSKSLNPDSHVSSKSKY